jgi:hypothetical protein
MLLLLLKDSFCNFCNASLDSLAGLSTPQFLPVDLTFNSERKLYMWRGYDPCHFFPLR